jgi:hypothetical protein
MIWKLWVIIVKRFLLISFVLFTLLISIFIHWRGISVVKSSPDIHQGDLVLQGNNVTVIEGSFDINGSIIVEGNATLILRHSVVNFMQEDIYQYQMVFRNPSNGNPHLIAENTTITSSTWFMIQLSQNSSGILSQTTVDYYLQLTESATVSCINSMINHVVLEDNVSMVISDTVINNIDVYAHHGSPYLNAHNSTIGFLMTSPVRVNCTFTNVYPGFINTFNYQLNSSILIAPYGWAPDVIIKNSTVNNWEFWFQQYCNAKIIDSRLYYLRCYYYSVAWLSNVSANQFEYFVEGKVYFSWYLDVHVTDSIGQDVPSATVQVSYPNTTLAESGSTNTNGGIRFTLLEKMVNETGEYPIGNYTIEATYDIYSTSTSVNMTENKQITLKLEDFVIPEFPSTLILPIFMTIILLAVTINKRKQKVR